MCFFMLVLLIIMALTFPQIKIIFVFSGALGCTLISFVIPSLIMIYLAKKHLSISRRVKVTAWVIAIVSSIYGIVATLTP